MTAAWLRLNGESTNLRLESRGTSKIILMFTSAPRLPLDPRIREVTIGHSLSAKYTGGGMATAIQLRLEHGLILQ